LVFDWTTHQSGFATDIREGLKLSINAGIDIDMVTYAATDHLAHLVQEASIPGSSG